MSATARKACLLERSAADLLNGFRQRVPTSARTSSEIIANMVRLRDDPAAAAERDAFYRDRDQRLAAERAAQEARWAAEEPSPC